jgi:dimeric dUTPase (all-alpha-NTP-PPase superfamily)
MDMFDEMFEKQIILQKRLNVNMDQQYINNMVLALHSEATELLDSTEWKPWKKNQFYDAKNYLYELSDIQHFSINLALAKGFTAKDVHGEFIKKNAENHTRQDSGY